MEHSKANTRINRFNPYDLELKSLAYKDFPKRPINDEVRKEIIAIYKLFDCALSIPDIELDDVLDDDFFNFHIKFHERLRTYFNTKHPHDVVLYDEENHYAGIHAAIKIYEEDDSLACTGNLYIKDIENHPKEFQNLKIAIGKLLSMGVVDFTDHNELLDYIIEMKVDSYDQEQADERNDAVYLEEIKAEHETFIEMVGEQINANYLLNECRLLAKEPLVIENPKSEYGLWLSVIEKCYNDNVYFGDFDTWLENIDDESVSTYKLCWIAYKDNFLTNELNDHLVTYSNQWITPFRFLTIYSSEGHYADVKYPVDLAYIIIFSFNIKTLKFYDRSKRSLQQLRKYVRTIHDAAPLQESRNIVY